MMDLDGMVLISKVEYQKLTEAIKDFKININELEIANKELRKALLKATSENVTEDIHVSRKQFIKMHDVEAFELLDEELNKHDYKSTPDDYENPIYGYDVTVHWHGMYCNCSDGATPSNHIFPAIEACDEELDDWDCE